MMAGEGRRSDGSTTPTLHKPNLVVCKSTRASLHVVRVGQTNSRINKTVERPSSWILNLCGLLNTRARINFILPMHPILRPPSDPV